MISKEHLDKFKSLYLRKYNTSLTDEEVTKMATDLLNLVKILIKPLSEEKNEQTYPERQI